MQHLSHWNSTRKRWKSIFIQVLVARSVKCSGLNTIQSKQQVVTTFIVAWPEACCPINAQQDTVWGKGCTLSHCEQEGLVIVMVQYNFKAIVQEVLKQSKIHALVHVDIYFTIPSGELGELLILWTKGGNGQTLNNVKLKRQYQ